MSAPIRKRFPGAREVKFFGFPVGARGKWYPGNYELLRTLGLGNVRQKTFAKLVSRRTLLYSLDLLTTFMSEREEESED